MFYSPAERLSADTEDTWCRERGPSPAWTERGQFGQRGQEKQSKQQGQEDKEAHYVVSEALPLLLSEGLAEALDQLVQLLRMLTQEVPDVVQTLQGGGGQRAGLTQTRVHL